MREEDEYYENDSFDSEDDFFILLTIDGTTYEEIRVKVEKPDRPLRDQLNSIIQLFNLPKADGGGNPVEYCIGRNIRISDEEEEKQIMEMEDTDGNDLTLLDYDVQSEDLLYIVSVPIAG